MLLFQKEAKILLFVKFVKMPEWWIASGPPEYWKIAFEVGRIWGVTEKMVTRWKRLSAGDHVLFYATKPVSVVIGYGVVRTKFRQDKPLWPQEINEGKVIWPYRFEFDVEYCLPPEKWGTDKVSSEYIAYAAIGGFQRIKEEEAKKIIGKLVSTKEIAPEVGRPMPLHEQIKAMLIEIGRLQGFIAEGEYPMDIGKLDVTWRRVERGAPTYAFEIHIGGDLYHDVSKLKHAHDLWNSNIFLITAEKDINKVQQLLSGTFHEIRDKVRVIDAEKIKTLYLKKKDYKDFERQLGIL